jgi:prophage antirepressor-like protein
MELSKTKEFTNELFGALTVFRDNKNNCWFKATQVADKLGYSNPHDAITRHCNGVVKYEVIDNMKRIQSINIIPEPDLYRLVFSSKLEAATKFQDWVFEDILPSIRQLGMYATDDVIEKMLKDQEWGTQLLLRVRDKLNNTPKQIQKQAVIQAKIEFSGFGNLMEVK